MGDTPGVPSHPTIHSMMQDYIRHIRSVQLQLLCKATNVSEADLPTEQRYLCIGQNINAWAGGAGCWRGGGSSGLAVGVVAHLAKRLRRAVMAWSCESRDEVGASAMTEER
eukprot:CCRYP_004173-RA/>CCRYP_004173-RA protein AED:0.40 eAED:0.40 QI:0/0/0/0.5/0/0/2/0/110